MPVCLINGISVEFPFEPYQVQKNYMEKVINCLQNGTNGVLESPTGTGKTLSLLCSSLAWLLQTRSNVVANISSADRVTDGISFQLPSFDKLEPQVGINPSRKNSNMSTVPNQASHFGEPEGKNVMKIIYASRTHSQLSQAMQELKNTSYSTVRAIILGSRVQLCIHPDVSKSEGNAMTTNLCKAKVNSRSCSFYRRVEQVKDSGEIVKTPILDIEDLITVGTKTKSCPFYLSKELVDRADIIFMPYNYLLDAKARKANNLNLQNTIIILDEAHNVEKMCEESGSSQISSTDIALAITDITYVMEAMSDSGGLPGMDAEDEKKDFTLEDLVLLKEMIISLEKEIDAIPIEFSKGTSFAGTYVFDLLEKANINFANKSVILQVTNALISYLATVSEKNHFSRRGAGLQNLADFLEIIFSDSNPNYRDAVERCFKVHISPEDSKPVKGNAKRADGWTSKKQSDTAAKNNAKIVYFWCFNPGFGMRQLTCRNIRSIILTSGTLAPLRPLINELNIPVGVSLENPHIIDRNQVLVKVVSQGPDKVMLNSSYNNRNNPDYILSLGRTVLACCPVIPNGLLVFFPSYTLLNKCVEEWQKSGIWAQINRRKPIFIEPRGKDSFNSTMNEYYAKINDPETKGAIFMAVCRGKVSEGLDFSDNNGRAVMITGLPFPPLMDARVVLKKQYLNVNRTRENEMITGDEWYSLEAARAVNQAIGRVIRHRHDFGAILLCDSRFQNSYQQMQLSSWIRGHLNAATSGGGFGVVIGELARFFRAATISPAVRQKREICCKQKPESNQPDEGSTSIQRTQSVTPSVDTNATTGQLQELSQNLFNIAEYLERPNATQSVNGDQKIISHLDAHTHSVNFGDALSYDSQPRGGPAGSTYKRDRETPNEGASNSRTKKPKMVLVPSRGIKYEATEPEEAHSEVSASGEPSTSTQVAPEDRTEFLKTVKSSINTEHYKLFLKAIVLYSKDSDFTSFYAKLNDCFQMSHVHYLLKAMRRFVKAEHKPLFDAKFAQSTMGDNLSTTGGT
ncbi:LOW QUALITY PROTEIN: regulator of telomere elongation helicase 1 homolog [Anopheles bellator]|uniref:LOW QUALITY PROTEIN: regulator of telomere elongation helicase 1 homolog n=1 Tax=Anopheles bellator TaxID=139047 RepID=UPI002648446D|nr:LOW QUALITY PROTEIN: regulator of telomere elongation helicase 1 homolog [Anopheles bellator]